METVSEYKLLIVDDEPEIGELLTYNFRKRGFEVATAHTGVTGFRMLHRFYPDVIILDIMMPDVNGIELCKLLKSDPRYRDIPSGGALILQADSSGPSGIVSSFAENEHIDLVIRRGGGGMWPAHPGRSEVTDSAFYVDGQLVAASFGPMLKKAIDAALSRAEVSLGDIRRFYFHQANKRVLDAFIDNVGIPRERVPMHVERYGNMVTAGTLVLLAEDLQDGHVQLGSGELIMMAALGAGAQTAAHVIRL